METKGWNNVTGTFSDKQRRHKNLYLETCEVYGEILEVSLFSSTIDSYEIYFSYGKFYGIIYVEMIWMKRSGIQSFIIKYIKYKVIIKVQIGVMAPANILPLCTG